MAYGWRLPVIQLTGEGDHSAHRPRRKARRREPARPPRSGRRWDAPGGPEASAKVTSREVVHLTVLAKPRASRSRVVRCEGLQVDVALAAPPADGAANAELIELLARALALPKSALRLALGKSSKHKLVEVTGVDAAEATRLLLAAVAHP